MTIPRGRAHPSGRHDQVVNYHHVIHALRRTPMALLNLVYRDQLFRREAYRLAFDALREALPERRACRSAVVLLVLEHDRGCETELADCDSPSLFDPLRPDHYDGTRLHLRKERLDGYPVRRQINDMCIELFPGFGRQKGFLSTGDEPARGAWLCASG